MLCLYRWVDCLNVELPHTHRIPNTPRPQDDTTLYDSDEEGETGTIFTCHTIEVEIGFTSH